MIAQDLRNIIVPRGVMKSLDIHVKISVEFRVKKYSTVCLIKV